MEKKAQAGCCGRKNRRGDGERSIRRGDEEAMLHRIDTLRQHEELWNLYTLKEEYSPQQRDRFGRIPYAHSTNQHILEPKVSHYLVDDNPPLEYPDGQQFAVCLTHDVDEVYPPITHTIRSSLTCLKERDFKGLRRQAFWGAHGKERSPYWNFNEIMDLEQQYSAHSSFYLLATDTDIRRFRYKIEDLEDELGLILDRGWEIGLHGGYYAPDHQEEIQREKQRLEQVLGRKVTGYRNHYLRFTVPDSWEHLARAGFQYDTTLGYPDMVGFRNGMCHPFLPYNLNTGKEVNILEFPMIIMDLTLFKSTRSYEEAGDLAMRLVDTVASYKGVLTLNWHSEFFNCPFRSSWIRMYEKILKYCHEKNSWMTSGEAIRRWWVHEHGDNFG